MPLIDFGRLNLPIEVKNLQKSHIPIPCTCSAKIEDGYSSEFWRSLEPQICNFWQKNLHRITLKSIFVNNLNLTIVRIPLMASYPITKYSYLSKEFANKSMICGSFKKN